MSKENSVPSAKGRGRKEYPAWVGEVGVRAGLGNRLRKVFGKEMVFGLHLE